MKYKVGDKVRVRKDLKANRMYGKYKSNPIMAKYKGREVIITGVHYDNYGLNINDRGYCWTDEMLEPIAESIAESDENTDKVSTNSVESIDNFSLEDLKFGDVVTLRNGEQGITSGEKIVYPNEKFDFTKEFDTEFNYLGNNEEFDIMKIERLRQLDGTFYKYETLYERKEKVLTDSERKYLLNIVSGYNKEIKYIVKDNQELRLILKNYYSFYPIIYIDLLKYKFEKMKNGRYTLKELGI